MEKKDSRYIWHKSSESTTFPAAFLMNPANEIASDSKAGGLKGYLY